MRQIIRQPMSTLSDTVHAQSSDIIIDLGGFRLAHRCWIKGTLRMASRSVFVHSALSTQKRQRRRLSFVLAIQIATLISIYQT